MVKTTTDAAGRRQPTSRRGFGHVRRLPSKAYQASYLGPDGHRHNAPSTFATKGDANIWLTRIQDEIRREVWKPPVEIAAERFGEYAQLWLEQRKTRKGAELRPRTREWYGVLINSGLTAFNKMQIKDITATRIRAWHQKRTKESGATQAGGEARVLRAILNTAIRDGLITVNPVPSELCTTSAGRKHRPPTPQELQELIDVINPRLRLAVQLAAFSGLRIGEWRALRRSDVREVDDRFVVNVERQALLVGGQWTVGPPKSADGVRQIALPAWLTDDVAHHLGEYTEPEPTALLFPPGGKGEFIDMAWRRAWDRARKDVGVGTEVREHDLRHYYGTALAESGATAMQLKSAMGHASINTSMGYVQGVKGATSAVADLLTRPGT